MSIESLFSLLLASSEGKAKKENAEAVFFCPIRGRPFFPLVFLPSKVDSIGTQVEALPPLESLSSPTSHDCKSVYSRLPRMELRN